jgi:2OG-Fe(II) oxygenase superfamily
VDIGFAAAVTYPELMAEFGQRAADYRNAAPFPHAVFHGLFDPTVLRAAAAEFAPPAAMGLQYDNPYELKSGESRWEKFGPATTAIVHACSSGPFVELLEALTGIAGLIPDPHLVGGGQHQIAPGGMLKIHFDHDRHDRLDLSRRVNAILFLNDDWREEWGGALEFWDAAMTTPVQRISPDLNTLVIFSTTDAAHHGHPEPLRCPPDRTRRSLAFYYYTSGPPPRPAIPHTARFRRRPESDAREPFRTRLRESARLVRMAISPLVPDAIRRRVRLLRRR